MLGLADFAGNWRLERVLTDHIGPMSGTLAGQAVLTPKDDGLVYTETGALELSTGARLQAERTYRWAWDAGRVVVFFADGSDFHSFQPAAQSIGTTHLCGADLYNVTYDFADWPRWRATWTVTGPRKNYTSVSRYAPM